MPIINVKFIEGVVATDEQKQDLIEQLTNTFVSICGDVTRPFVYVVIDETPPLQWGIAGKPMPDLPYLIGEEHAEVINRSNLIMADAIAQQSSESE